MVGKEITGNESKSKAIIAFIISANKIIVKKPKKAFIVGEKVYSSNFKESANLRSAVQEWHSPDDVTHLDSHRIILANSGIPIEKGNSVKMSKSKKNVVDPIDIIEQYGADTARWFVLSDSPPDRDVEWTEPV